MTIKIYQLPIQISSTVGVEPNFKYMISGDSLDDLTTAGYLNQIDLQTSPLSTTDVLQVLYDFNPNNQVGIYGAFSVAINNGIITLSLATTGASVQFPVIEGHFANWITTAGKIGDLGYTPSNRTLENVVMQNGAAVIGDFPVYGDVSGTLRDASYSPTNASLTKVVMQSGAAVVGHFPLYTDTSGTVHSSSFVPTDPSLTHVVMQSGAAVVGHFSNYHDTNGSIIDLGFVPSDPTASTVAMVSPGSNTPANLPQFNDTSGTIGDSGINSSVVVGTDRQKQMGADAVILLDGAAATVPVDEGTVTINRQCGYITTADLTGDSASDVILMNSLLTTDSVLLAWATALGTATKTFIVVKVDVLSNGSATFELVPSDGTFNGTVVFGFAILGTNQ